MSKKERRIKFKENKKQKKSQIETILDKMEQKAEVLFMNVNKIPKIHLKSNLHCTDDENIRSMRENIADFKQFKVHIHEFKEVTIKQLQILNTEYGKRYGDTVFFIFGANFKVIDLSNL